MHTFKYIAALSASISAVIAAPLRGGEFVINTVTEIETVTEIITATVWVDPATSTSTTSTSTTSTLVVPTEVPATTTTSASPTTATSTSTSTSIYVAPVVQTTPTTAATTPTTTVIPTTTSTTPAPVVQTPTTTSTYVAPEPTTTTTPAAAATTTQSSSSSSSSSQTYTGDITHYDVGLGSCGYTNSDTEMVVAMAVGIMNKATMCDKTVTISYGGSTHIGTIVDTCMGCADGALDLSPALFTAVAPDGDGRVSGVEWWFN